MKHIGWCLDKIQMTMMGIPRDVISGENKAQAKNILNQVEEYLKTLSDIITNPNFKKTISMLEHTSIEEVKLQAHEIEELFKDLEHALYVIDLYIKDLNGIIESDPSRWNKKADQIVLMIDQKFGGERGDLRKEFQVALHTQEELQKIVTSEKHLAEFLS
ncbi:hypothetical protein JXM83_01350 [Candidatus Woesearchaeota archaeon]|nr:hypothetical protein [Candidatus Woesearchaeota archaeon]